MRKNVAITIALTGTIICLITMSTDAKQGAINGIALCENVIIPALLPILILTNIIIKTNCRKVFEKMFGWFVVKVFCLPRCATTAIIFGLIGGYPAGAILTNQLFNSKLITSNQATRIMRFNFCGGVAFIITAVGSIMMNNTFLGVILYLINIVASIIIALVTAPFSPKSKEENAKLEYPLNFADALVQSVEQTVKSLLLMSGYIILFSAINGVISPPWQAIPLLEITNGMSISVGKLPLNFIAMFLSFGGVCIHLQIIGVLNNIKMKYWDFLLWRVISGGICFGIGWAYLKLVPQTVSVFSNLSTSTPQLYQVNSWFSIVMILGCAVLIFDIEGRKKYHSAMS